MRKLAALLLALALLAPGALAESDFPVYQVRAPGSSATVYLFPSIHAADERGLSAFADFAGRLQRQRLSRRGMRYIHRHIRYWRFFAHDAKHEASRRANGDGPHPAGVVRAGEGLPYRAQSLHDLYENYHPFLLLSTMENAILAECGLDALQGLDMHFLQLAHEEGKAILEIESIEEQTSLMVAQMPTGIWPVLLESYLPPNDAVSAASTGLLYEALLQGNANALETMLAAESTEVFSPEEQALYNAYNDLLLTQRDAKMTAAVLNYLAEGKNVFVVVGAAHVLGPTGLVDSLQSAGCAVRRVE